MWRERHMQQPNKRPHIVPMRTSCISVALLMPPEPVHGCVCFGQPGQRLLDFFSRGVSALIVPDHLLPQQHEHCGAINVISQFKVEGRDHQSQRRGQFMSVESIFVRRSLASITRRCANLILLQSARLIPTPQPSSSISVARSKASSARLTRCLALASSKVKISAAIPRPGGSKVYIMNC